MDHFYIRVRYEPRDGAKSQIFKTRDTSIEIGDLVVVPTNTRYNMTVCLVIETGLHSYATVGDWVAQWVVCKIDTTEYDALREEDRIKTECPNASYLDSLYSIAQDMRPEHEIPQGLPSPVSGAP